jgi:hypothetical protein
LGIAEDVPMKVGHHFIPINFVVLEMGKREKLPLILGRPFLKTVGATIDVARGRSCSILTEKGVPSSSEVAWKLTEMTWLQGLQHRMIRWTVGA